MHQYRLLVFIICYVHDFRILHVLRIQKSIALKAIVDNLYYYNTLLTNLANNNLLSYSIDYGHNLADFYTFTFK